MAFATAHTVAITTDGSGDATVYTPTVNGRILALIYTKADFATGVDFAITTEDTGQGVWTEANVDASTSVYPQAAAHSVAGVALTYDATQPVTVPIYAAAERVKVVISNGGATKTGSIVVVIG